MKFNKYIQKCFIAVYILFFCVFITCFLIDFKGNIQDQQFIDNFYVKSSDYWDLTGSPIFIDDADPNYDWSNTSNNNDWCRGSGTWTDPYIIENITIDGQNSVSCITIQNSSVFFVIRNCSLSRAGWDYDAGIKLDNVNNSLLIYNSFTANQLAGILLWENCVNNTIKDNKWDNDEQYCVWLYKNCHNNRFLHNEMLGSGGNNIYFYENNNDNIIYGNYITGTGNHQATGAAIKFYNNCDRNIISNNNLSFNYFDGIIFQTYCDKNVIKNNVINNNAENHGIFFYQYCNDNTIYNNTISEGGLSLFSDGYGVFFYEECDHNNITQNIINDNDYYGVYLREGSGNNTISENIFGNFISSNQETAIFLEGSNDNIITGNIFLNNAWRGIDINANSNNTLVNLNFFYNSGTEHARDLGTNNDWNNSAIGNFWDTYVGVDDNQDGIGDSPYNFGTGIDYLPIYDDDAPNITIIEPAMNQVCGVNAPNFIVEISDVYLDETWYSLNNGQNITFTNNGAIDQFMWNGLIDGNYDITFYANDTFQHLASKNITVIKDTLRPTIDIISPLTGSIFNTTSLSFTVEIFDVHLDKMWYTIDSGTTKYFFTDNGTIQGWSDLPNGPVTITFFANDTAGNVYSIYTTVIKQIPDEGNGNGGGIPGYNILLVYAIFIASIGLTLVLTKKKRSIK